MATAPTLEQVEKFVERAHGDQVDKLNVPYINHLRAVAQGVAHFGDPHLTMGGLLHDVLEDTPTTEADLRAIWVPERVIHMVVTVTKVPDEEYDDMLRRIAREPDATRLKISDNAHNRHPDRVAALTPKKREHFETKYQHVPEILWKSLPREEVASILAVVNPSLLPRLAELN